MLTVRMVIYTVAAFVAAMGFGAFDAEAGTLTLNLGEIAAAVGGAGILNAAVVSIWGKR